MQIVPYSPSDSAGFYSDYYSKQVGHGISVYKGKTVMPGYGIGSFLSGLAKAAGPILKRTIIPLAKRGGKALLKTGLSAVEGLLSDPDETTRSQIARDTLGDVKQVGKDALWDVHKQILGSSSKRKSPRTNSYVGVKRPRRTNRTPRRRQQGRNIFY